MLAKLRLVTASAVAVVLAVTAPAAFAEPGPADPPEPEVVEALPATDPSAEPSPKPSVEPSAEPSIDPTPEPTPDHAVEPSAEPVPTPTVPAEDATREDLPEQRMAPMSDPAVSEIARPTIATAGAKGIGLESYAWGRFATSAPMPVWLEYQSPEGWERRSQGTTSANGQYTLRVDVQVLGEQRWRAAGRYPNGQVVYSDAVALTRLGHPTSFTAGTKQVCHETFIWGAFETDEPLTAWSEVLTPTGWSRSQVRQTDASGHYAIPLTYGACNVGTTKWRVAGRYADGSVLRGNELTMQRLPKPTITTAGTKLVGETTYAWGSLPVDRPTEVSTQVWVDGRWSTSQKRTTSATGYYEIPLTYGATTAGTYRWRVAGTHTSGTPLVSDEARLQRLAGADVAITRTTTTELARHWNASCPVGPDRLSTIRVNYWDFDGNVRRGTMIVRNDLAGEVGAVLRATFDARFPIARMDLPTAWDGNDVRMMADNNSSAFNCRKVVGNPYAWSPHAYGIAVDLNPRQNPYRDPSGRWYPSTEYSVSRPVGVQGMLYRTSTPVREFQARGWRWESGWDWHHFQKVR